MANLRLTLACGDYDLTRALIDGTVQPPGIDALLPDHPTLGDVRTAEELASYQAGKRAAKAARRAAAK